jgi:flagellar biosynthesis protein FlhG
MMTRGIDQGASLRIITEGLGVSPQVQGVGPRSIAITSGKGGVGKTSVAANLAFILAGMGLKVVVLDADMGLANVDVILGLSPRLTLRDFLFGNCDLRDILLDGPGGIRVLPGGSGQWELTDLSRDQQLMLVAGINTLREEHDLLLIDTAAGLSSNVLRFNALAEEVLVVVTPEPTSITDAYAIIKLMFLRHRRNRFLVLVNEARNEREAREAFEGLNGVVERFLRFSLTEVGSLPWDPAVTRAVKSQKPFAHLFPEAKATHSLQEVAGRLRGMTPRADSLGGMTLFGPYA